MTVANSSNKTSTDPDKKDLSPDYVSTGAITLVVVLGVFGNLLVIYSIWKRRTLLKKNYYYLVSHLAVSDLILLLTQISTIYSRFVPGYTIFFSSFTCKTFPVMATLFFISSSNFMILIAIFRYRAVFHPLKPAVGRWKVRIFVALAYICSFICLIPYILVLKYSKPDGCVEDWPKQTLNIIYTVFLTAIQYFIPVIILSLLYYKIWQELIKQNEMISTMNSTSAVVRTDNEGTQTHIQTVKHHRNIRTFINCVVVVICYAIAGFPYQLYAILRYSELLEYDGTHVVWLQAVLFLGSCSLNPFIYGVFDKTILFASKSVFRKKNLI